MVSLGAVRRNYYEHANDETEVENQGPVREEREFYGVLYVCNNCRDEGNKPCELVAPLATIWSQTTVSR